MTCSRICQAAMATFEWSSRSDRRRASLVCRAERRSAAGLSSWTGQLHRQGCSMAGQRLVARSMSFIYVSRARRQQGWVAGAHVHRPAAQALHDLSTAGQWSGGTSAKTL